MSSIDQQRVQGERVLYRARPHWIVLVAPLAIAVALGVPGVLLIVFSLAFWMDNFAVQSAFTTGLVMVIGTGAIALGLLHQVSDIAVTDRRMRVTSGVLVKCKPGQWPSAD
jgi:membrane protein YdbS with pleckstrin-like domain